MAYDFFFEAAEVALAGSMKDFEDKVAATGRDLNASAVSLSWKDLAGILFEYLCKRGIDPLNLPADELNDVLFDVSDALEWTADGDLAEVAVDGALEGNLDHLRSFTPAPDPVTEATPD